MRQLELDIYEKGTSAYDGFLVIEVCVVLLFLYDFQSNKVT